jgi:hypothetical protein
MVLDSKDYGVIACFSHLLAPIASMPGTKQDNTGYRASNMVMVRDSNGYGVTS